MAASVTSKHSAKMEHYWIWASLLVASGAGLALLEVFIPSGGILGFLSASALIAAVVLGFMQDPIVGMTFLAIEIVGVPLLLVMGFKYWPHTRMGRRVLLMPPSDEDVRPVDPEKERLKAIVGRKGLSKSKMLLSGVIDIDGERVDAVSESMPIEPDQPVVVLRVQGNRVVVRPLDDEPAESPPVDPLQQLYDDPFDSQ